LIVSAVKICEQCLQTASVSGDFVPQTPYCGALTPDPTMRCITYTRSLAVPPFV